MDLIDISHIFLLSFFNVSSCDGDNFAVLFIGWEGVGVCSWLLIGFGIKKESATWAANETFIMNRVGDLGLLLGMFIYLLEYWKFTI